MAGGILPERWNTWWGSTSPPNPSPKEQNAVTKNPHVIAASYEVGGMCVAVDKSMTVFRDQTCIEIQLNVSFASVIKCFTVSQDGAFLFVGVSSGDIYCLHLPSQGKLVFAKNLLLTNDSFKIVQIFCHYKAGDVLDLMVLCNQGQIYRMPQFNVKSITDSIESDSEDILSGIVDELHFELLSKGSCTNVCAMETLQVETEDGLVFGGLGIGVMSDFSTVQSQEEQKPLDDIKKIQLLGTESLLVVLTAESQLLLVCPFTLLPVKVCKESQVQDFTLLPQSVSDQTQDILMLTKSEDKQHSWLQLASLPTFSVKLRLKVSSFSYLVSLSTDQQELLYLEGIGSQRIDTIHIKTLVESTPIDRFERILRRKKFDEAEKYANTFNLDIELVYKARARQCLDDLDPWVCRAKDIESSMTQLISILDSIQDIQFVCEWCMGATLADLKHVRRLLTYASQRLTASDHESVSLLTARVCALEFRLETFEINNETSDFEAWLNFAKLDLLKECLKLVQQGSLHKASFIWTRHFYDFKWKLTDYNSVALLQTIPIDVPLHALLMWLRHFIPSILTTVPQVLEEVIQWAVRTSRAMELDRSCWPESGLEFAQQVLDLMKVGAECDVKLSFYQQYSAPGSGLHQLIALIKAYRQLKTLKDEYFVRISLADFMEGNKAAVVTTLLDLVTEKNLSRFSVEFLERFMDEWGLDSDVILSEYIQGIVLYSGSGWDHGKEAPWEATVAILLPRINKYHHVIESVIAALRSAPVPWSSNITAMAERGLKLKHPLTKEIRHQRKLVSMKIVLNKYNFKRQNLERCDFRVCISYIHHIIKQGRHSMLEDCLELSDTNPKLQAESYQLYFEHCVESGNEVLAFQVLDKLEPKMMEICIRKIIYKLSCSCSSLNFNSMYATVLDAMAHRLEKCVSEQQKEFISVDNLLEDLRHLYMLQNEFSCEMTKKEYVSKSQRSAMLKSATEILVDNDSAVLACKPQKLATILKMLPDEGAIEFMKQAVEKGLVDKAVDVARRFCYLETMPMFVDEKLYSVIVQLMQLRRSPSETDMVAKSTNELSSYMCLNTVNERVRDWLEVFTWSRINMQLMRNQTQSGFNIMSSHNLGSLERWTFSPLYFDQTVYCDKSLAVALVGDFFQHAHGNVTLEVLQSIVSKLQEENHDLVALNIVHTIIEHLSLADTEQVWLSSVRTLLYKVILNNCLDADLALGLLSSVSEDSANCWLNEMSLKYQQDLQKLHSVAKVGLIFHKSKNLFSDKTSHFEFLLKQCVWTRRAIKLGVSPNETFSKHVNAVQVLKKLMYTESVSTDIIKDFCDDFALDLQEHLLLYLQTVILNWEPTFEILEDLHENKILQVKNDDKLTKTCHKILKLIELKDTVFNQLEQLWDQINYYNYETYSVAYELMDIVAPKRQSKPKDRKLVLLFLKSYNRVRQPDREETELWTEAFPHACGLPPISKWRLPFHQFLVKDAWSVVKSEVNLDSYETWLQVAPLIGLNSDRICSVAIRQTIGETTESSAMQQWSLHVKDNYFVNKISSCVERLADLQMASAALYYVVKHTLPGIDQANLARLCYEHTRAWAAQDSSPDVDKILAKVHKMFLDLATSHVLHLNGLGRSEYLKLSLRPEQLVDALYADPSVAARGREAAMASTNINNAVEEICTLHGLNATKLRLDRLADCLKPSLPCNNGSLDDETCTNVKLIPAADSSSDDLDLLKACYILDAGDTETAVKYLTSIAFGSSKEQCTEMQLRALKCLSSIASETKLAELTGQSLDSIRNYMQSLNYVVQLSRLGASYSMSGFDSCDKLELMKMIWQCHSRNPHALVFITQLCFDYNIFQIDVWDLILGQMTELQMMRKLEVLLPRLTEHKHILNSPGYIRAWDCLLITPFSAGDIPLTAAQETVCIQRLILLQSCPVLSTVNLSGIVVECTRLGSYHLGATLLPFMRGHLRELNLKVLLKSTDASTIIANLKKSTYKELLTVPKAVQILEESMLQG